MSDCNLELAQLLDDQFTNQGSERNPFAPFAAGSDLNHLSLHGNFNLIEVAEEVHAAGWRPPARGIVDPAELDALPRGSAVLTRNGRVWQKAVTATTEWWPARNNWVRAATSEQLLGMGIVTMLHVPSEDWLRLVPATEVQSDGA
ncbi:hypothetical protein [Nocardia sp. NPDC051463]|uniref:hypothetical protein n=1 Tax=Nocardia sp. NPDC051463 TaxID=3154845 RepID=UPI00344E1C04